MNVTKHIAIISSPRVGSTWFQDSLRRHFSLAELFNTSVDLIHEDYNKILSHVTVRTNWYASNPDVIEQRIEMFKNFEKNHGLLSIKVHSYMLEHDGDQILDFIKNNNFQVIVLDRKNKVDTIMSDIISDFTHEYHMTVTPCEIIVTPEMFDNAVNRLYFHAACGKKILNEFSGSKLIYYEDALKFRSSWWWRTSTYYVVQNAKAVTTITNQDEVNEWISRLDFNRFQICSNLEKNNAY